MRLLLVLCLITQLIAGVAGQQPAPSPSTQKPPVESDEVVRINTTLVQVDAVVTDKSGKIVSDLKPEEVEIFEDSRQQKITHFSYNMTGTIRPASETSKNPATKNASPMPAPRLKREDVKRAVALVVDDLGLSFESVHFVRRALKKFVDEQMEPGDLVAIIRTSGGMGALQQFTSDKRQLYAAIERVKFFVAGRAGISAFAALELPTKGKHGKEIDAANNAANDEINQLRDDMYSVGTLGAITYVVRGLRELPGRKSVLLISDGVSIYNTDDPTRTSRAAQKLDLLMDEAARSSVVIYTMNATGLQVLGPPPTGFNPLEIMGTLNRRSAQAFETQAGLDYLARQTGGFAIQNTNDLSGGIRRVMEDQSGYYLIGYRPSDSTFDPKTGRRAFHHLRLKIKRAGKFNVRMRKGFFGVSDEEKPKPRTLLQRMAGALASPFDANGVRLQLTSFFANDPVDGSVMRSFMHIDGRDLTFTDEPDGSHKAAVIDLLTVTFGDNGVPVDQIGKSYRIRLGEAQYKRMLREGLVYKVTVPIKKPGAYQLRISLRDSVSDRIGSASQFIEAPDIKKNRLALSGIVIRGEARTASDTTSTDPGEGVDSGSAEASPAVRHFKRGMVMTYGLFIYNARIDKATMHPQLITQVRLFRDGKEVFAGNKTPYDSGQQTDMKRLPVTGGLFLGTEMSSGEYMLQLIVTDLLADKKYQSATQWIDFQIVD
jgi:VWFA-related protein